MTARNKQKMKQTTTILFGLLVMTLTSCSTDIHLVKYLDLNSPLTLMVNRTNNQTGLTSSDRILVEPKSEKFKKLVDWCHTNISDWQSTPASYIAKVSLTQNDFRLLYNQDFVVVGFKDNNGRKKQYSKKVLKGQLDFLTDNDSQRQTIPSVNSQSKNDIEQIIFGVFCGECDHNCATMYSYHIGGNSNMLWVDYMDSYFKNGGDKMTFGTQITDIKKYELANDIVKHIPDSLLLCKKTSETFGCPDCTDGCGIYFEMIQNRRVKKFYIDYSSSELSGQIKEFAEYLKITIRKFNDEKH